MDGESHMGGGAAGGAAQDASLAILDRLDSIGRLLARGPAGAPDADRLREVEAHLVTRIDMLGRIVEQVLSDREGDEARLAALASRLVDLEASLAPALARCADQLDEAVALMAESTLERLPGGGASLRVALRELRAAIAVLQSRAPAAPPASSPPQPRLAAPEPTEVAQGSALEVAAEPVPPAPAPSPARPLVLRDPLPPTEDEALARILSASLGDAR